VANITWRIGDSVTSSSNSQPISGTHNQSGSTEDVISVNYPSNTNHQLLSVSFGAPGVNSGNLQAIILLSSQNMTVYTNNTNAPQDTINLVAGIPVEWDNSRIYACPFNGAVTAFYVSCNAAALLSGKILKY
jgi:hypothetical protein